MGVNGTITRRYCPRRVHPLLGLALFCLAVAGQVSGCKRSKAPPPGGSGARPVATPSASASSVDPSGLRLDGIDQVAGHSVGEGGGPGAFYLKLVELTKTRTDAELEQLTKSRSPVARALGLAGLAHRRTGATRARLEQSLHDRSPIEYFPGGCVGSTTMLGEFAWQLLREPDHLWPEPNALPLVDARELDALNLELLAADDTFAFHFHVARVLGKAFEEHRLQYVLADLQSHAPRLKPWQIILAVGRMPVTTDARQVFLSDLLGQASLDAETRLASASALTRIASDDAIATLEDQHAALNALGDQRWGDRLLDQAVRHRAFERKMAPVEDVQTWMENERLAASVVMAFNADDAFAVDALLGEGTTSFGARSEAVYAARDAALLRIARGLHEIPPFATWHDTRYQLHWFLQLDARRAFPNLAPETRSRLRPMLGLDP